MFLSASTSHRLTKTGTGSPEAAVTALVGTIYVQTDASPTSDALWYKQTGSGNTGWVQVPASAAADAELAAIAGLTSAADTIPYFTGSGTAGLLDLDDDDALTADSDTAVPTQAAVKAYVDASTTAGIPDSIVDAKGDLIAATAADTVARLAAGTDGHALIAASGESTGLKYATPYALVKTETASYPLVLADAGKWIRMNVATANDLTVPLNATQAFPVGTEVHVEQMGAGQTTIVATGGVTINTPETLLLAKQWAVATLKKVATDEWTLAGYLEV